MKFDCGESHEAWLKRVEDWHPWFAWRPVRVGDHDCRWFEWVERKLTFNKHYLPGPLGGGVMWFRKYRARDR